MPYVELLPGVRAFAELGAKFALNAISTYAHVSIGKVYKNRMVDLSVSNTKLYHRSIAIVAELMGVSTVRDSFLPALFCSFCVLMMLLRRRPPSAFFVRSIGSMRCHRRLNSARSRATSKPLPPPTR